MMVRKILGGLVLPLVIGLSVGTEAHATFLQTDPIGYQDNLNLYAYVGGDPINKTDPTGEQERFEQGQRQLQSYQTGIDLRQAEPSKGGPGVTVDAQVGAGWGAQGGNIDGSASAFALKDGSGKSSVAVVATGSASMQGLSAEGPRQLSAVGGGQEGIVGGGAAVSAGPSYTNARSAGDLQGGGDTVTISAFGVSVQVTRGDNGVMIGTVTVGPGMGGGLTKQRTNTEVLYDSTKKDR